MTIWFAAAALLSIGIGAIHVFAGGPTIARPLLRAGDLEDTPKYTQYYCWHLVSIALVMMAAQFAGAALVPTQTALGLSGTLTAAGFAAWGVVLPPLVGQSYVDMPQGWLFVPVAILGGIGCAG